jgi:hypothetical protein
MFSPSATELEAIALPRDKSCSSVRKCLNRNTEPLMRKARSVLCVKLVVTAC